MKEKVNLESIFYQKINKIFLLLIIFFIFFIMKDIFTRIQFVIMCLYLVFLIVSGKKFLNVKLFIFIMYISISSVVNIIIYDYFFYVPLEQFIVFIISILCFYNLVKHENIYKVFKTYLNISFFFSYIGLLQLLFFMLLGIKIGNAIQINIHGLNMIQVSSLVGEPASYAQMILPGVIFTLEKNIRLKKIKLKEFILLLTYVLSFTAITYFSLGIYIFIKSLRLLKAKKYKKIILVFSMFYLLINSRLEIGQVREKIGDSFFAIFNISQLDLNSVNLSTVALLASMKAAINSKHILFGNGIGTMGEVYYRYLKNNFMGFGLNYNDGYSFFNRIFSEFGVIGLIIMSYIIFSNTVFFKSKKNKIYIINLASFVGVASFVIRAGSYYRGGTIIFFIFLIFSYKEIKKQNKIIREKL